MFRRHDQDSPARSVIEFTEAGYGANHWRRHQPIAQLSGHVPRRNAPALIVHANVLSAPQNKRARAAAFSRRCRSRSLRYSSSAARSAAVTEAWVGTTQAVGQRVTPFVRMYSATTVS